MSRQSAVLASPSEGAARTRALKTARPSARRSTPSIASRPPRGVSRTSMTAPSAVAVHGSPRVAGSVRMRQDIKRDDVAKEDDDKQQDDRRDIDAAKIRYTKLRIDRCVTT